MDLLNTTLGAVGQVGDAIDKYTGGRAVRGTLAGKPRELASIVPFSDTIGLTRPEDATSGRDLTDSYGLTTKGSNSFGSHAAGFVADNVLSPANWLGAGTALKAAPTLAKGAVGAAKALTGADLLDHVAGGAKKLGSFLGGESGALDIGAFGSKSRSGLAPQAVASTQVNSAIKDAAKQFARYNPDTQFGPSQDLAARFIRPPELPSDPGQAKQLADQFTDTMAKGRDSASAYFGPTYYDINNYLRTLGPEAAQAEVKAIREGRARVPGVTPPKPLSDPQKFDLDNFYKHYGHSPDTFSKLSPDEHGDFVDQLSDYFGPKMSKPYIDHFKGQSAPSTAAASIDNWDDTPALAPSPFQNIPAAPTFIPDPAKLAEFDKLAGVPHKDTLPADFTNKSDFGGVQAVGKQVFGDQYDQYVNHIKHVNGDDFSFDLPNPSKPDAFDEADLFGLPPDSADSIDTSGWDDFLKENNNTAFGDHPGHEMPLPHPDSAAFTPDPAKIAEFQAKHGMEPYDLMDSIQTKGWAKHMDDFFGPNAVQYKKHYIDKAIADGEWDAGPDDYKYLQPPKPSASAASTQYPHPVTGDPLNVGQVFKMKKGKGNPEFVMQSDGTHKPFVPEPSKPDAFDEADFFGLPPDGVTPDTGYHVSKPSPLAKDALDPDELMRLGGVRKHIAGLSGLIDNSALPQDMDLFRGVDGPGMRKISELIGAPLNSPEAVGREFVDPAFMSTAFNKRTADSFAGLYSGYNRPDPGVTFTFPQVPAGKPASFMNASEHEVLFPPGRKVKITDNSNYPHLKAELYGTLLAAILGRQAAQYGGQNGNP